MKRWQWPCASERLGSLSCPSSKLEFPRRMRRSDGLSVQWCPTLSQFLLIFGDYSFSRCVLPIWPTSCLLLGPSRRCFNDVCLPRWSRSRREFPLPLLSFRSPVDYCSVTFLGKRLSRDPGSPE